MRKLPQTKNESDNLSEHNFIASCLKCGLTINDLKQLTYKDVAKILLCFIDKKESDVRQATQQDWDILAGG